MMVETDALDLALSTVRSAGDFLLGQCRTPVNVLSAEGRDIKLVVDRESEAIILTALQRDSDYPILTEERGKIGAVAEGGQPYWVVDPLDGSLNFKNAIPFYCVSIALWRDGDPLLGVVYDLPHGNLYHGICDAGAFCDSDRIHVSGQSDPRKAVLATGFPTKRSFTPDALRELIDQFSTFKKVRMLGAAALSLAYCSAGKVDAYCEDNIMLWDVAAGIALVKAAGGWVSYEKSDTLEWGLNVRCGSTPSLFNRIGNNASN